MSAKKSRKSKQPVKGRTAIGGNQYNIEGGIHAQGDVVLGRQYKNHIEQIITRDEFQQTLQQVQADLATLKQQAQLNAVQVRIVEAAEAKVQEAQNELAAPAPAGNRIRGFLNEAREWMDTLTGTIQSAASLGATIGWLAMMAIKVFGG